MADTLLAFGKKSFETGLAVTANEEDKSSLSISTAFLFLFLLPFKSPFVAKAMAAAVSELFGGLSFFIPLHNILITNILNFRYTQNEITVRNKFYPFLLRSLWENFFRGLVFAFRMDCFRYWEKRRLGVEEFLRVKKLSNSQTVKLIPLANFA